VKTVTDERRKERRGGGGKVRRREEGRTGNGEDEAVKDEDKTRNGTRNGGEELEEEWRGASRTIRGPTSVLRR
jgi:hypothetical protein